MLAKIGSYTFELDKASFDEMSEQLKFDFAEHKRLNNHSSLQAVGKWSQAVTLKGLLVQQKMSTLDALVSLAKKKKPVRFTTIEDDFDVVILAISKSKTLYNNGGSFMAQSYNVQIKRVFKSWQISI